VPVLCEATEAPAACVHPAKHQLAWMRQANINEIVPGDRFRVYLGTHECCDVFKAILRGMWIAKRSAEPACGHRFVRR
jgi:hypothetical protein